LEKEVFKNVQPNPNGNGEDLIMEAPKEGFCPQRKKLKGGFKLEGTWVV